MQNPVLRLLRNLASALRSEAFAISARKCFTLNQNDRFIAKKKEQVRKVTITISFKHLLFHYICCIVQ